MDTINRMNDNKAETSPSGTDTKQIEPLAKRTTKAVPTERELNYRVVATLLKAVCCFLQLSQGLKLGNFSFWKSYS